VDEEEEWMTFF